MGIFTIFLIVRTGGPFLWKSTSNGGHWSWSWIRVRLSLMSKGVYQEYLHHVPLKDTDLKLRTFAGEPVEPMGFFKVTVQYKGQGKEVTIYVMKNEGPTLFLVWSWCLVTPYCEKRGAAYWLHIPVFVRNREKYSQFEKDLEDLSLVWGVKKFQSYLGGRHFTLVTNNQPLKYIMDPRKAVPVTAAARIQRWCLLLGASFWLPD